MPVALLALLALAYCTLVLFVLAGALARRMAPRRAALSTFVASAAIHGVAVFLAEPERWLPLTLLWLGPHLLLLPVLLFAASRRVPTTRS